MPKGAKLITYRILPNHLLIVKWLEMIIEIILEWFRDVIFAVLTSHHQYLSHYETNIRCNINKLL